MYLRSLIRNLKKKKKIINAYRPQIFDKKHKSNSEIPFSIKKKKRKKKEKEIP